MLFFKTKRGQVVLNFLFSFFAAVVILGALFKIRHWEGADLAITVGLLAEVVVFLIYAFFVPPPEEAYWERYYPNITEHPDVEKARTGKFEVTPISFNNGQTNNTQQFNKMLDDADINQHSLTRLSDNFRKLGTTVERMTDITDVVATTGDYTARTREATNAMAQMTQAYTGAAQTMQHFNNAAEGTRQFHEQVQVLTKNLSSLNAIYELELQDTNNHLKAMNRFYGNLVEAADAMHGSAEDARRAHEQISNLANNLGRLNGIYGNMISAMQGRQVNA
ncbi:MAG: gliding motility protein GldL [Chitinophagaceae bacterium]